MKYFSSLAIVGSLIFLSSCATIFGGSSYLAEVTVKDHPKMKISYRGKEIGKGHAFIHIRRKNADKVAFTLSQKGYETSTVYFNRRSFRGAALVGSLLSPTYLYIIPIGVIVDASTGSFWKPNLFERGVSKINYNHYRYLLEYTGKKIGSEEENVVIKEVKSEHLSTTEKLRDLKKLLDEGVIDEDEFKVMKAKVIGMKVTEEDSSNTEVSETKANTKEDKNSEKLKDLDKMLEMEVITQEEYDEMRSKILNQ